MLNKQELRIKYRSLRNECNLECCQEYSREIIKRIRSLKLYQDAKTIAIFYPMNHEVDLLELQKDPKRFCFPKVITYGNATMDFFEAGDCFKESAFGIQEPTGVFVNKDEIDLFFVPGLVFSIDGHRIGYGKGFYDSYLKGISQKKIGVGYSFQIIQELPSHENDQRLDMIITNQEVLCIPQLS